MLRHNMYGISDWIDVTIGRFEHVPGTVMIRVTDQKIMIEENSEDSPNDYRQTL